VPLILGGGGSRGILEQLGDRGGTEKQEKSEKTSAELKEKELGRGFSLKT